MNLRKCVVCEELASGRVSCVVGAIHANPVGTTDASGGEPADAALDDFFRSLRHA